MSNLEIGKEILRQLGGNKFIAMTGAKQFLADDNKLMFRLPRADNGINRVVIALNSKDLYDISFERFTVSNKTLETKQIIKATFEDIYCDQLVEIFEKTTKLYTSL